LGLQEVEHVLVETVGMRLGEAVGSDLIDFKNRTFDDLRGFQCGSADRHDLIIVAMNDERRLIDLLEVVLVVVEE
jgi:hypothetical protein